MKDYIRLFRLLQTCSFMSFINNSIQTEVLHSTFAATKNQVLDSTFAKRYSTWFKCKESDKSKGSTFCESWPALEDFTQLAFIPDICLELVCFGCRLKISGMLAFSYKVNDNKIDLSHQMNLYFLSTLWQMSWMWREGKINLLQDNWLLGSWAKKHIINVNTTLINVNTTRQNTSPTSTLSMLTPLHKTLYQPQNNWSVHYNF